MRERRVRYCLDLHHIENAVAGEGAETVSIPASMAGHDVCVQVSVVPLEGAVRAAADRPYTITALEPAAEPVVPVPAHHKHRRHRKHD